MMHWLRRKERPLLQPHLPYLPARRGHPLLLADAADQALQLGSGAGVAEQFGMHLQAGGVDLVLAVQGLQAQATAFQAVQHEAAHLDLVLGAADDFHAEMQLHLAGWHHVLMVQALGEVAQQDVGAEHHQGAESGLQQQPHAAQHADGGGAPEGGGGVEATHVETVTHDHAPTEETYPGDHVGGDVGGIGRHAGDRLGHQHEQAGPGADQGIGAQPGEALAQLAFGTDQGAQGERHEGA